MQVQITVLKKEELIPFLQEGEFYSILPIVKELKEVLRISLKEAKELVESQSFVIKCNAQQCEKLKNTLKHRVNMEIIHDSTQIEISMAECDNITRTQTMELCSNLSKSEIITKNPDVILVQIDTEKLPILIANLPISTKVISQEKVTKDKIEPQIQYHHPTHWLFISEDYYKQIHKERNVLQNKYDKLKELNQHIVEKVSNHLNQE